MRARSVRRLSVGALALAGVIALSGCGGSTNDAATVTYKDGPKKVTEHIGRNDINNQLRDLIATKALRDTLAKNGYKQDPANTDSTDAAFSANWLTQQIRATAIDSELADRHLKPTPAQNDQAVAQTKQQYGDELYNSLPKSVRNDLVAENANLLALVQSCPSGRLVEHILLPTKAAADAAYLQIKGGQQFADVARTKSTDTQSAQLGGVLGCLMPNEFVPEFQTVAEKVPLDTVTVPVKSRFGYHLILARPWDPSLATQPQIAQSLQSAAFAALNARLQPCGKTSTSTCLERMYVDPRFGSWGQQSDPQGGTTFAVTPPKSPDPRSDRG